MFRELDTIGPVEKRVAHSERHRFNGLAAACPRLHHLQKTATRAKTGGVRATDRVHQ
jgi:hypothetical protein